MEKFTLIYTLFRIEFNLSIRNLKINLEQYKNKLLNQTYTPHPRDVFFIDPTGLCNLGCRFCAYPKLENGFSMTMELYNKILNEALDLGFTYFFLTPMLEMLSWIKQFLKSSIF